MSLWDSAEAKLIGEYFVGKSKIKVLFRFLLFFFFSFLLFEIKCFIKSKSKSISSRNERKKMIPRNRHNLILS